MIEYLEHNPILMLMLVIAIGQVLGQIRIFSFNFGIAAVLFVGLAVGALDPKLQLPDFVYLFGLILFVYTIGLSSGPGFFASFRRRGLRDTALTLVVLVVGGTLSVFLCQIFGLDASFASGIFSGALTNTPALAAAIDYLKAQIPLGLAPEVALNPVVAYSIAYPGGVIGMLIAIWIAYKIRGPKDLQAQNFRSNGTSVQMDSRTIRATNPTAIGIPLGELRSKGHFAVSFGRLKRDDQLIIATDDIKLVAGDLISVIGKAEDLQKASQWIGEIASERLDLDRTAIDFRRIFVSRKDVTERPLKTLKISERFGATITRVRRGDVEFIPDANTFLELGDRVRIVAPRQRLPEVATFFGDSYRALSEIDIMTFSLGLTLGLVLGKIPIPIPGGNAHFELGLAGGPLIVGLILGRLGRTGPLVWTLPYSANLILRQLGIVLFLAGIGIRSGYAFVTTLQQGGAFPLFLSGLVVTLSVAALMIVLGYYLLKIPIEQLVGMMAGVQTQPAALAFAVEREGDEEPNTGYASVYPIATILKIVFVQVILLTLS